MSNDPLITKFEKLVKDLNTIIFGDDDQDVILDDIVKPTISKWLKSIVTNLNDAIDIAAEAGAGANGWTAQLIVDASGVTQQTINNSHLTVDNFGAKGNGIDDDSEAFQKYIDSPLTPNIVYLGKRSAKYRIEKEVDFKGKGLVGHGYSTHNPQGRLSSIFVPTNFVGSVVFKNIEGSLRNINAIQEVKNTSVNFAHVIPYLLNVDNLNIDGFGKQIFGDRETCVTSFSNIKSINNTNTAIYFPDTGIDHTTTYFNNIHFQWGNYSFVCEGNCYGFSFNNIVVEQMLGGLKSKLFTNCSFDNFWCEGRQGQGGDKDVIEQITGQQLDGNNYGVFRFVGGWTAPQNEDKSRTSSAGGIAQVGNELFASDTTGARIVFGNKGIRTSFSDWYSGSAERPRALVITTQDFANESGYQTPIVINAPNNQLYFGNYSALDYTPVRKKRVVAKKKDVNKGYYGYDELSAFGFIGEAYNPTNGKSGTFQAPMFLTWDAGSTIGSTNAGWKITKIATGHFQLIRDTDNTLELMYPNLLVSGILSSAFLLHRCSVINSYDGSWSNYRAASGFNIYFQTSAGASADPERFTVAFTLR